MKSFCWGPIEQQQGLNSCEVLEGNHNGDFPVSYNSEMKSIEDSLNARAGSTMSINNIFSPCRQQGSHKSIVNLPNSVDCFDIEKALADQHLSNGISSPRHSAMTENCFALGRRCETSNNLCTDNRRKSKISAQARTEKLAGVQRSFPATNENHQWVANLQTSECSIRMSRGMSLVQIIECVVLFVVLVVLSLVIFSTKLTKSKNMQRDSYLVFPVVIWASFRFNRVGLPLAVVIVAVIASAGTQSKDEHALLQVMFCISMSCNTLITNVSQLSMLRALD